MQILWAVTAVAAGMLAGAVESTPATVDAAGYVPKTPHDNTPWRFDMNQNGKRMTAAEFQAWMQAKGIRIATGKPATPASSAAPTATPAAGAPLASAACPPPANGANETDAAKSC